MTATGSSASCAASTRSRATLSLKSARARPRSRAKSSPAQATKPPSRSTATSQFSPEELTLIEADALKLDWTTVLEGRRLRIIGNLPYNISSPLLFALMSAADRVIDQHFMLQREVVDRMVAEPDSKTYGRLSVMLQYRYVMHKLFDVPPGAFVPPPKVTSSIVRMVPRPVESLPEVDMEIFSQVVALAFQQRRKTLRNALSTLMDDAAIKRAGVNPAARAETLDVAAFVRLAREAANLPHHADAV